MAINTPNPEYLCNLGLIHFEEREFDAALRHFQEAQRIYQDHQNLQGLVTCLMNIGLTYDEQDRHELALLHLQKSRSLAESLVNQTRYQDTLAAYKTAYSHLSQHLERKVLQLLWDNKLTIPELLKLGDDAYEQTKYYEADYWYQRAEQLGYSLNDPLALAEVYQNRDKVHCQQFAEDQIQLHKLGQAITANNRGFPWQSVANGWQSPR